MAGIATPTRPLADLPDVLTADEAAPYMRASGRHVRDLIARGDLDHLLVQIGRRRYISRELLRRFLAGELDPTEEAPAA